MDGGNVIHFDLLGSFPSLKAGKKTLSFLQYLIVNHERNISATELIEQFWAEDTSAPGGALRRMVFKVRELLEDMFPEKENLLLTLQGCYTWNPEVRLEIDAEQFETVCLEARKEEGEKKCEMLLQAIILYKGDFLSGNDSDWTVAPRQYYQTLYLDACKKVLPLLYEKEQWMKILSICSQAYAVDFAVEEFTVFQMHAYIAMGQPERAVRQYEVFRDKIMKEYEVEPASQTEKLYTLASSLKRNNAEKRDVFKLVCEDDGGSRAFLCTFDIFQKIVALERRHMDRSGEPSSLVVVSLGKKAIPVTDARRLERILLEELRTGDPVAKLASDSYVLMLTGASAENAHLVMKRIEGDFRKTYRHSRADVMYRIEPLQPKEIHKEIIQK